MNKPVKEKDNMKCTICKQRDYTIIIDDVKMCIACYDLTVRKPRA